MDIKEYNDLSDEKYWEKNLIDVTDWIKGYLTSMSVNCKNRFTKINHPLVESGKAFWVDNNTLCIGYKSKLNDMIYVSVNSKINLKQSI